ncbi:tripartite tricarboxylate transporter permease [Ammoniphilus sp. 3BR4]|uniref:tripartite tricarboxylate transporter permease n=1 Tax=Ammoniphilus sp. 3BR4 TaxID=3158265 RepID=UPI003464FD12
MDLLAGFSIALSFWPLLAIVGGVLAGLTLGALPGLTSTMALAVLMPLTFGMDPILSICMLIGIYVGGICGGSITAICINIPGTPASAATAIDGNALFKRGEGGKALFVSFLCSAIGGLFSAVILITLAPAVAKFGLKFGPPEYFALGLLGLTMVLSVSGKHLFKGLAATFIGLMIATIGVDPVSGFARYTAGSVNLQAGISYIPALIGLFGLSEMISNLTMKENKVEKAQTFDRIWIKWAELKQLGGTLLRSSSIGTAVGAIPGAGADIASWVSYDVAKRTAKKEERIGEGNIKGVAASEAANNANVGGALIPMMTFGIPGDGQTAVLIGALMISGMTPGPLLFEQHPDFVGAMMASVIIANILIFVFGISITRFLIKLIDQPTKIINPIIILLCLIGAFAINNSFFDVGITCLFGLLGVILKRYDYPLPPLILALILAPMIESNFRKGLTLTDGQFLLFFQRPLFLALIAIMILSLWGFFRMTKKHSI